MTTLQDDSHDCDDNAACNNVDGSFYCTCNNGYRMENDTCQCKFLWCIGNGWDTDRVTMLVGLVIDCGDPGTIRNGNRSLGSFGWQEVVTYSCFDGFRLVGLPSRLCGDAGMWSGSLPDCLGVYCTVSVFFCLLSFY